MDSTSTRHARRAWLVMVLAVAALGIGVVPAHADSDTSAIAGIYVAVDVVDGSRMAMVIDDAGNGVLYDSRATLACPRPQPLVATGPVTYDSSTHDVAFAWSWTCRGGTGVGPFGIDATFDASGGLDGTITEDGGQVWYRLP